MDSKLKLITSEPENAFIANVRYLMHTQNITEAELARQTNIPQSTLHKILTGKTTDPRLSTLQILAAYFKLGLDELVTGAKAGQFTHPRAETQSIPIISWHDCVKGKVFLKQLKSSNWDHWVVIEYLAKEAYGLISKPSMDSRFPEGTILIVAPDAAPKDGDLVVVHYPNTADATLRKLSIDGPMQLLAPIIPGAEKDRLTDEIKILGVVLQSKFSYAE